jgi:transcriptional regulator with XRE-family HTH domain
LPVNPNPMTREQIKKIRADLGISAASMARLMRVNERTVFSYESGRSLVPGCAGAYLDLLMFEPAAAAAAFKMAGLTPRKIRPSRNRSRLRIVHDQAAVRHP